MHFFKSIIFILLCLSIVLHAENKKLQHVSIQLEWKHQFEFAGFYAAKEKGYYQDAGLDVEIKEYHSGVNIINDVLSGVSTYGMTSSQLILERLSGKRIIQLASYFKQNALVLIAKPNINTVHDLKNKSVMAADNEFEGTSLAAMIKENGLEKHDIRIIPQSFNIEAFEKGEIDAMTAFISNQPFLLNQKKIPYKIFNPSDYGIYSYDVELFTSENEGKNHPLKTQRFIEATRKGWEYALSHKEEIVNLIYEKYSKVKSKDALLYEANVIHKLMKTDRFNIGVTVPELTQLNTNMYVQLGMVDPNWDLKGFVFDPKPRKINLTPTESEFIKDHPIIRFSDVVWKPFASVTGKTYSGIFKDYYELLSQRTGIEFEFVKVGDGINFQLVLDALKRKEIDMIDGSGKTVERGKYALFAGPIMQVGLAIASNKFNSFFTLENLHKKTIAVAHGSTSSEYLKEQYPNINLIFTDSIEEALDLVSEQKADAVIDNFVVLDYIIKDNPEFKNVNISTIRDYEFDIYALIRDDYPVLQQILAKAIRSITQEEVQKINNKLLRSTVEPNNKDGKILNDDEYDYLAKKKEIKVCVDPDWMPFEKIENGEHKGFSADYLQLIASKVGIPITLLPTTNWTESIQSAKERKCDILSLAMTTDKRKKYLNFSRPYVTVPLVITTTNSKFYISEISELQGKKIGVGKNYAFTELLKQKYPSIHFVTVNTITDALEKVIKGELFGYIDNQTVIAYHIQNHYPTELKISGQLDEKLTLGIAVRNDDPILLNILNKISDTINQNTKQKIYNEWVSVKYEKGFDTALIWQLSILFLLLIFIIVVRQYFLQNYNKKLKDDVSKKVEELREKDKLLLNKYRMAEMGEMLSMIAHQWRQPLGAISSALMSIEVKLASGKYNLDDSNAREKILTFINKKHQNINDYVNFLSTTTDDFRNFFNPNKSKEIVPVSKPVKKALGIVQISMQNSGIEFITDFKEDTEYEMYQNKIIQVILNILNNSKDNFLQCKIENPTITIQTYSDSHKTGIIICDNGGGISEAIIDKVCDPYFSTKDEKNGTGLGLYMSKIMIEEYHNGVLSLLNSQNGLCTKIEFNKEA